MIDPRLVLELIRRVFSSTIFFLSDLMIVSYNKLCFFGVMWLRHWSAMYSGFGLVLVRSS